MPRTISNMALQLRETLRACEAESDGSPRGLWEARERHKELMQGMFRAGHLTTADFSIREAFHHLHPQGPDILRQWQMRNGAGYGAELMEAAGGTAVGYSDFSHVTGQVFFTDIIKNYENPEFVFSAEIPSKASTIQDIEKIPGITRLGSTVRGIAEGQPYPRYGVGENYIEVAAKQKDGGIVEVTKEIVAGDKTGVLLDNCGEMGYTIGYGKEERAIDATIDQNAGAVSVYQGGHRYTWRGTAYATYQSSTPWINVKTSNAFTDETSIDPLWQVMVAITDPFNGRPILNRPKHLILGPELVFRSFRVLSATEVRQTAPGYATTGGPAQTVSAPALGHVIPGLKLVSSPILKARMSAASEATSDWFLGDLSRAITHYYNWDITPEQRGTGTDAEFERDVVLQFKASLKDCFNVRDPRYIARSSA